jgi:hypothetical protein
MDRAISIMPCMIQHLPCLRIIQIMKLTCRVKTRQRLKATLEATLKQTIPHVCSNLSRHDLEKKMITARTGNQTTGVLSFFITTGTIGATTGLGH